MNQDIDNKKLIKMISKNKNALKIISVSNDSIDQIEKAIKLINHKTKTIISITDFNKKLNLKYLRKIETFKKKFNLKIVYGNHSQVKSLSRVLKFKPEFLLMYVKLDNKVKYPDSFHAICLNSLRKYLKIFI